MGGDLNSPVVERLNKGLMAVLSPSLWGCDASPGGGSTARSSKWRNRRSRRRREIHPPGRTNFRGPMRETT
eukprot:391613-Prorocentrum_minimum.AAC.1